MKQCTNEAPPLLNGGEIDFIPYDTGTLSFGLSGSSPIRVKAIRIIEWLTGKITLLRMVKEFDQTDRAYEGTYWAKILELLRIEVRTSPEEILQIPAHGPVVVVSNHPFGFVDGLVLADMVSRIRPDLKILTHAFFATLPEIDDNMVPVAFSHDFDSINHNIAVRKEVMQHLQREGVVILFPAGRCATARTPFGAAIEHDWNPFTAKMILRSKARVVPVYFPGQNSRLFQFSQIFSATLRQSLMMHEIKNKIGKPQYPRIGPVIEREEIDLWRLDPRGFMKHLRSMCLAMKVHNSTGV